MNTAEVKRIIEAVLLCAQQPMPVAELRKLFADEVELSPETLRALLDELRADWHGRAVELVPTASGWRFRTTADVARFVERLNPDRAPRYSRAVLETLAIIAYRQPVTRGDIEEIRGVSVSAQIVKALEDRGWIEVIGHKEVVGRPALFATTRQFLDDLGLRTLQELPSLEDAAAAVDAFGQAAMALAAAVDPTGPVEATPPADDGGDGATAPAPDPAADPSASSDASGPPEAAAPGDVPAASARTASPAPPDPTDAPAAPSPDAPAAPSPDAADPAPARTSGPAPAPSPFRPAPDFQPEP